MNNSPFDTKGVSTKNKLSMNDLLEAVNESREKRHFSFDTTKLYRQLLVNGFLELPINHKYTKTLENLPIIHRDPFDRMLIAQSLVNDLCLIANDEKILQYQGLKYLVND